MLAPWLGAVRPLILNSPTQMPLPGPWFGFHEVFHALTVLAYLSFYAAVSLATYTAAPI